MSEKYFLVVTGQNLRSGHSEIRITSAYAIVYLGSVWVPC